LPRLGLFGALVAKGNATTRTEVLRPLVRMIFALHLNGSPGWGAISLGTLYS
jgi:hypothetical protein